MLKTNSIIIVKLRDLNVHTREWIKLKDLNPNESLFGGRLLEWIDEKAALHAIIQMENPRTVTQYMSEIDFRASAKKAISLKLGWSLQSLVLILLC